MLTDLADTRERRARAGRRDRAARPAPADRHRHDHRHRAVRGRAATGAGARAPGDPGRVQLRARQPCCRATLSLTPELLAAVVRQYAEWAATSGLTPAALRQRALRQRRVARDRDRSPPPVPARPARRRRRTGGRSTRLVAAEIGASTATTCTPTAAETSVMLAVAPELVHLDSDGRGRRPGPHRRPRLPLHRARPVDQRRHRPAVRGDRRARPTPRRAARSTALVDPSTGPGRGAAARRGARSPPSPRPRLLVRRPDRRRPHRAPPGGLMDTIYDARPAHTELADEPRRPGRASTCSGAFIDIIGRAKSKVVPIDHLPQPARRLRALHATRDGRPRPDDARRGRVRDRAGPVDAAGHAVGSPVRVDGRRPLLRRHRAVRPLHPVDRSSASSTRAADLGFRFNLGVETEIYVFTSARSTARGRLPRADGSAAGTLRPTPAYDVEATIDAMPFLDPMVAVHERDRLRRVQLRRRGRRRRSTSSTSTTAPALEMADQLTFFRLMAKQVAKQAGLVGHVHAQALHRRPGAPAPTST